MSAYLRQRLADALFAYNTPQAHHFVIHDGGYEGIADAVLAVLRETGTVEKRARCVTGSCYFTLRNSGGSCSGPHPREERIVLPWTAVET